jgi:hypothetical protein
LKRGIFPRDPALRVKEVHMTSGRAWTDEELDRLRELDGAGRSPGDIARALDRDEADILDRLTQVRIRPPRYSGADEEGDMNLDRDAVSDDPASWVSTGSTLDRRST